ncbi:serine-rich adhesin for platelets [Drosophila biarmipes]|uniref:serine-rich adhesin for platelets n=1 Tax=Drosophila biarmipes TaxID=125945 RepID=UPI0007E77E0B|nr:serine-rich adhesin for platelets [Drosophila biarmipes]XP_050744452.1 serine-rich adhesin for platelets [Drosophila biarmipes]
MRVVGWFGGGLMLALAVMLTQARFIAKRETPGLEQAVASTSTDPDILPAASESGSDREPVKMKAESDTIDSQSILEDRGVIKAESQNETEILNDSLKENLNLKKTTEGLVQNESNSTTEGVLEEDQLKPKEGEAQLEEKTEPVASKELENKVTPADSVVTASQLDKNSTNLAANQPTEAPVRELTTVKQVLSSTTENTPLSEKMEQQDVAIKDALSKEEPQVESEIKEKPSESSESTNSTAEELPMKHVTLGVSSTTERLVNITSTTRSSDHGRSMQYSSTTAGSIRFPDYPVTPMKLRPIPLGLSTTAPPSTTSSTPSSTPSSTTSTTTPKTTTPTSFASHENAIEESTSQSEVHQLPEKRAKFISENSTNAQQLTLPNTAEVWSLAGMKAVPKTPLTTTTILPLFNHTDLANDIDMPLNKTEQHKEKNLLDWMHIAMMPSTPENRTEFVVRTTLDATESATQATTEALDEKGPLQSSITAGLEQNNVTTARPMPVTTEESSTDHNSTTTTLRTEVLEVPAVKKLGDTGNAKLTEASTEAQTDTATFVASTEQPATSPATARVDLTKTELLNAATVIESAEKSQQNSTETLSTTSSTTTTTEEPLSVEYVSPEVVLNEAKSEETTAATPKASTEASATSSTSTAATTSAEAAATSEGTTATPAPATPPATSSVAATPSHSTTEMATKASEIGNISSNNDDDDNSNDVIVATTKKPESEPPATAIVEPTATSVSVRLTGEVSTSQRPEINVTSAQNSTSTSTTTVATPTQTEIAQISNEVNLEAVTVKTTDDSPSASVNANVNANGPRTAEKTDNAVNNSVAITESELETLKSTPATGEPNPFSDLSELSKAHESSLETNNIGEAPSPASETTTPSATAGVAVATDESTAATGGRDIERESEHHHEGQQVVDGQDTEQQLAKTTMAVTTTTPSTTTPTTPTTTSTTTTSTTSTTTERPLTTTTMQPVVISLLDDSTSSSSTTTTTTTAAPPPSSTEEYTESSTGANTTSSNIMLPESTTTPQPPTFMAPYPNELDHMQTNAQGNGTDVNVIIAITVSVIGVVALILLVAFLYLMRKRQKQMSYGQRCRPVSLDAYSLDNVSVLGSVRRKGRDLRASKRTYGNAAFDDPSLRHNLLTAGELARFVERRSDVFEEFRDVPQIIARADEVPPGCEDKNRYANVIPLPETRVVLQRQGDDDKTEYINANYVRGPRDAPNYYIACQAPLESTTSDFWRMIWEQQSRVIIQATDLSENGIEKCAEYLPPSATLDNHSSYGDYQVTLKHREVKDRYAISTLVLKRVDGEESRELTHYWYKWPETGVPAEEAPIIAMLLEARSSLKSYCLEQANELREKSATLETSMDADASKAEAGSTSSQEINGNVSSRSGARNQQGPLTVHCSPGTGRTGTIIASDMAIRSLETPKRSVDIPQLVYYVRRGRASAVQTKEQYEFIYKVASMYAAKITNLSNDN